MMMAKLALNSTHFLFPYMYVCSRLFLLSRREIFTQTLPVWDQVREKAMKMEMCTSFCKTIVVSCSWIESSFTIKFVERRRETKPIPRVSVSDREEEREHKNPHQPTKTMRKMLAGTYTESYERERNLYTTKSQILLQTRPRTISFPIPLWASVIMSKSQRRDESEEGKSKASRRRLFGKGSKWIYFFLFLRKIGDL